MTIKIGGVDYPTRKPKNLDDVLAERTGINAAETARLLAGIPTPARLAAALRPYLGEDAPSEADLGVMIGNDPGALQAVRDLYAAIEPAEGGEPANG